MNKLFTYEEFLTEKELRDTGLESVNEGGAYGHLTHPFEDLGLTMTDVKDMIDATVQGAFGPENFVQEKTDGQQLSISWKNGQLIAARNKSHLKNAGENAMTSADLAAKFKDRGDIEIAYNAAMRDLSASIGALSPGDKEKMFGEGTKFASVEIMTPVTQNTVPYGQDLLVFHGIVEYDVDGNVVGEDKQAGRDLGKMIADANAAAQEMFYVRGPQDIPVRPFKNTKSRAQYYNKKLNEIMKDAGINLNSTVHDFVVGRAINVVRELNMNIPEESIEGIANRLGGINKSYSVAKMKKDMGPDLTKEYSDFEKKNAKMIKKQIYAPLENLFLEVGTEMMMHMEAFLSANPTHAGEQMRKEIETTINTIRKNGDATDVEKLEHELTRVAAVGGLENIVPTEGITFVYKGKVYKYTGIFAPIHQIRSILAYKK
jgi:hypothetical protein